MHKSPNTLHNFPNKVMTMFAQQNLLLRSEQLIHTPLTGTAYHIAFAANPAYLRYVGIAIFSILENHPDIPLHFHLFTGDMPDAEAERFQQLRTAKDNFCISTYYLNDTAFSGLQTHTLPAVAYYRLVMPAILSQQGVDRVLYLDADTLCLGDLSPLLDMDLHGCTIGAAADCILELKTLSGQYHDSYLQTLGFQPQSIYFNSGVLLIDIKKWHSRQTDSALAETVSRLNAHVLTFADQDMLNIFFQNDVCLIPKRYNCYPKDTDWPDDLSEHPARIVHFAGSPKPWQIIPEKTPAYAQYALRSPWRDTAYPQPPYLRNTSEYRHYAKYLWQKNRQSEAIRYYLQYLLRKIRLIPKAPA